MKTNLRPLLFCAALAGLLPLTLAAQAENPPAGEKSAPAAAAPAPSPSTSSVAATPDTSVAPAAPAAPTAPAATSDVSSAPPTDSPAAATSAASSTTDSLRRLDEPTAPAAAEASEPKAPSAPPPGRDRGQHTENDRVTVGGNASLAQGEVANSVVAVGGNATNEGEVNDSVVAIAGNARSTGPARNGVVAIFGNAYVDAKVGQVVAVFGNIELGPNAEVHNDVVAVLGEVKRDPKAIVHGNIPTVGLPLVGGNTEWMQAYLMNCVLKGRPLAIAPHLAWAWYIAVGFLLLYVVIGLLFPRAVEKTVGTLETRPGGSILAALLTLLLTPILIVLLCLTVVGVAVVPFLAIALMCASLFGKGVMLAWIGRRITRLFGDGPLSHPAFAILLGGVIVLALYLVPFVGFLVYKLLGFLGLGVVVYTVLLASKREKRVPPTVPVYTAPVGISGATVPPAAAFSATGEPIPAMAGVAAPGIAVAALPRAGFWIRIGALLIDVILIGIVKAVLPSFLHLHFPAVLLMLAIYGAVLWKMKGTTIGGIICGLRVVRADGREIDWATALVRALGCFVSLFALGLGFIWVAIDDEKQSWHDKIAGTVVVHSRGTSLV